MKNEGRANGKWADDMWKQETGLDWSKKGSTVPLSSGTWGYSVFLFITHAKLCAGTSEWDIWLRE